MGCLCTKETELADYGGSSSPASPQHALHAPHAHGKLLNGDGQAHPGAMGAHGEPAATRLDCEDEFFDARNDFSVADGSLSGAAPPRPFPDPYAALDDDEEPDRPGLVDEDALLPPLDAAKAAHFPPAHRQESLRRMRAQVLAPEDTDSSAPYESRCDATLERFLRARDFKPDVAAALFLTHRKFRTGFGWAIDSAKVSGQFSNKFLSLPGRTASGCTLLILHVAAHDAWAKDRDIKVIQALIVYTLDKLVDGLSAAGQFVVLADFSNFGSRNYDIAALAACFDLLQKFYVERAGKLWFHEPPTLFWVLWKFVKPFVAPSTADKIAFLYGKEALATYAAAVPADVLPVAYGGRGVERWLSAGPAPWEDPSGRRRHKY